MKQRTHSPARRFILGIVGVGLVFALWELASLTGILPAESIPPAHVVVADFIAQLGSPEFWKALWDTLRVTLIGLGLIILIAVPAALLIGLIPVINESTWFILEFLKPIPPVAIIPLGLLLWGPTDGLKLILIVFGAIWPLLIQLVYAIKQIDPVGREMSRSYRLGWWLTTSRLVAPTIMPFALTGLRVSASIAVIIAIVTEMVGGAAGLGQSIVVAQSAGALGPMYALILAAGLLGLLINAAFRTAEKPLLFWHPSVREESA
ncbi:ABC transporter permease [Micrococcoides hystricis]|uniref:ABC transporter permease n=1 Tax=Micrococcoides hystricis TaxID=1572761 RepID=A0ABV6PAP1_9MICC